MALAYPHCRWVVSPCSHHLAYYDWRGVVMPRKKRRDWMPEDPYQYLLTFRVMLLRGRYGGGKTSLAVFYAARLLAEGKVSRVVSNVPLKLPGTVLEASYPSRPTWPSDSAVIYDESWLELGVGAPTKTLHSYLAYLRKANCFLLLPSVLPLARTVRGVVLERVWNGYAIGLPVWIYAWELPEQSELGWHAWWQPSRVWGWYDTEYRPGEDWFQYGRSV